MNPSCCAGITGVNGSLNANFRMSSNDGGRRKSMISSLCAARVLRRTPERPAPVAGDANSPKGVERARGLRQRDFNHPVKWVLSPTVLNVEEVVAQCLTL